MDKERSQPNSTELYALSHQEFGHHLWSNAIYIILMLKREGLIHSGDIDPINRHLPASQRPKMFNRHSAFQVFLTTTSQKSRIFQGSMEGDPVVQVALISESSRLQMMLSTYGITTQTPHEVEPVQIWPSWRMVKVCALSIVPFRRVLAPSCRGGSALKVCKKCVCVLLCVSWPALGAHRKESRSFENDNGKSVPCGRRTRSTHFTFPSTYSLRYTLYYRENRTYLVMTVVERPRRAHRRTNCKHIYSVWTTNLLGVRHWCIV